MGVVTAHPDGEYVGSQGTTESSVIEDQDCADEMQNVVLECHIVCGREHTFIDTVYRLLYLRVY